MVIARGVFQGAIQELKLYNNPSEAETQCVGLEVLDREQGGQN